MPISPGDVNRTQRVEAEQFSRLEQMEQRIDAHLKEHAHELDLHGRGWIEFPVDREDCDLMESIISTYLTAGWKVYLRSHQQTNYRLVFRIGKFAPGVSSQDKRNTGAKR